MVLQVVKFWWTYEKIARPKYIFHQVWMFTLGYRITVSTRLLKRRWIFLGDSLI